MVVCGDKNGLERGFVCKRPVLAVDYIHVRYPLLAGFLLGFMYRTALNTGQFYS